ncbi:MAG: T9SS type A sorting domain-containing protein, partial [Marinilabiliaceae bacterium]
LSAHRVYYKLNETDKDYLLYDFALDVNETATCALNLNNPEAVNEVEFRVEEIDSVKLEDGKHRRLRMKFFPNPESPDEAYYMDWIEGIGSTTHPFYPSISLGVPGSTSELLCYHRGGAKVYQNPGYSGCDVSMGLGHALSDSDDYVIRSSKDVLKIESRNGLVSSFHYKIFNTSGKRLKDGATESGMVNISDLPTGVYIIRLEGEEGFDVFSDKFVKY